MQTVDFTATDDADFAATILILDNSSGDPLDLTSYEVTFQVTDCGSAVLTAKTSDATLERGDTGEVQFRFPKSSMTNLCAGKTYKCGCVIENGDGEITQIFVGSVVLVDGGLA